MVQAVIALFGAGMPAFYFLIQMQTAGNLRKDDTQHNKKVVAREHTTAECSTNLIVAHRTMQLKAAAYQWRMPRLFIRLFLKIIPEPVCADEHIQALEFN